MRLPIPEIYIHVTTSADEGRTKYEIVDGQQRIRTVLQFLGSEIDPDQVDENRFLLDKLPLTSPWHNFRFSDLSPDDRQHFYSYLFAAREIKARDEQELRQLFTRLNRFLEKLKPQEIRNALYTGPFVDLATRLADSDYWITNRIVTPAAVRRMADVEFVSELLIGVLHGPQGGSAAVIDSYYAMYEDYDDEFPDQKRVDRVFNQTLQVVEDVLPSVSGIRWANKTDFYSLFVAIAGLLTANRKLVKSKTGQLRATLARFASDVNRRLGDEGISVSTAVVSYVRAVEKGANDKKRRADRHQVLLRLLNPYFPEGGKAARGRPRR